MMKKHLLFFLSLCIVTSTPGLWAQDGAAPSSPGPGKAQPAAAAPTVQTRDSMYRLQDGDVIDISFALTPEFNQSLNVQPDGYVSLQGAGAIHAAGLTVAELTTSVRSAYSSILRDPIVTISLKDFVRPYFIAAGQISRPGKFDLHGPLTVTQAVAVAGGFNDKAKHSTVVLYRPAAGGGYEVKILDIKKLMATRNLAEDVTVMPGDTIYVPQSDYSRIRPYLPMTALGAYYNPAIY